MRLYYGCPDKELQAVWNSRDEARARLRKADPRAWCTYFPLEGAYSCARWIDHPNGEDQQYQDLTPEFHPSIESACAAAIAKIQELEK